MIETSLTKQESFTAAKVRRRGSVARALFGDIVQFVDFILIILSSVIVAYAYHYYAFDSDYDPQRYAAAGILGATGLTALLRRDGYYDFDRLIFPAGSSRAILSRWALVVLGLIAFAFALKVSQDFSRAWLFGWTVTTMAALAGVHYFASSILKRMSRAGGAFARRIAVVGATTLGQQFADRIGAPDHGVSIVGLFDAGLPVETGEAGVTPSGSIRDLIAATRNGEVDDIVIAVPRTSKEDMARLVRRLSNLPVSIAICPNIHWLDHQGGGVTAVAGVSVLSLYRRPLEGWGGVLKTAEDFVLGAILLTLAMPVMGIIALAIKLQGNGPILFSQQRHGFNNAVFKIYKFRTMTVAEDGDKIVQAHKDDLRITPLGAILRRYSLDELPQLFNVVRGEMSLVGPRPHALAHNHQYAQAIENYSGRHNVKPGITGWAQVNGFRGETSENEMMAERVRFDLAYVDNWSLWFDLKILLLTFKAVVFPKNAV